MGGRSVITRRDDRRIFSPNVLTMPRRFEEAPPSVLPPGVIPISPWMYDTIDQGTWDIYVSNQLIGNGCWYNTTDNDGDALSYKVYLEAGTYTFKIVAHKWSNYGIMKVKLDGDTILTEDLYAPGGSPEPNVVLTASGITVAAAGVKTIQILVDGKNGSATDYYIGIGKAVFYQTEAIPSLPSTNLWAAWKSEALDIYDHLETVTSWADGSGNGRDLDVLSGTPSCATGMLGDHKVCVFQSAEYIASVGVNPTTPTMTVFAVSRGWAGAIGQSNSTPMVAGGAARGFGMITRGEPPVTFEVVCNDGVQNLKKDGAPNSAEWYIMIARHQIDLSELWINGALVSITNETVNYTPCLSSDYMILGGAAAHPLFHIAECGVYNAALSDADIINLRTYLSHKFEIYP